MITSASWLSAFEVHSTDRPTRSSTQTTREEAVIAVDETEAREAYRLVNPDLTLIHGAAKPPSGYRLAVPTHKAYTEAIIHDYLPGSKDSRIHHPPGVTNMLLSIFQIIFASFSLGISTRHQIPRWGYASYGLSVFPYALMSIMNLFCAGLVGVYSSGQILRTPILEESNGQYDGIIGAEIPRQRQDPNVGDKRDDYVAVRMARPRAIERSSLVSSSPSSGSSPSGVPEDLFHEPLLLESNPPPPTDSRSLDRTSDSRPRLSSAQPETILIQGKHQDGDGKTVDWSKQYIIQPSPSVMPSPTITQFTISALSHNGPPPSRILNELERITWGEKITITSLFFVALIMPYALLYVMTGFHPSESTVSERAWMMAWLAADQFSSFCVLIDWLMWKKHKLIPLWILYACLGLLTIPSIGGYVTLGRMFLIQSGFGIGNCET